MFAILFGIWSWQLAHEISVVHEKDNINGIKHEYLLLKTIQKGQDVLVTMVGGSSSAGGGGVGVNRTYSTLLVNQLNEKFASNGTGKLPGNGFFHQKISEYLCSEK